VRFLLVLLPLALVACDGVSELVEPIHPPKNGPDPGELVEAKDARCVAPASSAHIVFQSQADGHLHRIEAKPGGEDEDLTVRLDLLGPGVDDSVNASPDGDWLVFGTTRVGCASGSCIAVGRRDACAAQSLVVDGKTVPSRGTAAIASGGDLVIYPAQGPSHVVDLFAVRRSGGAAVNLTASSPARFNQRPAISDDGARVLFACGPAESPSAPGTALCEVGADGAGLRTVASPAASTDAYIGAADFAPNGGLVAEANQNDVVQLFAVTTSGQASVVSADVISDTSPCVLPDGRIASVWAGRDPASGLHEIKIADADGKNPVVLTPGVDVADVGIGCSR
jgi:hypothetical protein